MHVSRACALDRAREGRARLGEDDLRVGPDGHVCEQEPPAAGVRGRLAGPPPGEVDAADVAGAFDVRELADGRTVTLGPLTLTSYRVEHPVEAYGVRVEARAGPRAEVLAYTGDTDTCPALLPLAKGADLFLAEASFQEGRDEDRGVHLTGLRAGQAAADAGCRRLLLTHVPVWTDPRVVVAEARSAFPGPVELARPGDVHVV